MRPFRLTFLSLLILIKSGYCQDSICIEDFKNDYQNEISTSLINSLGYFGLLNANRCNSSSSDYKVTGLIKDNNEDYIISYNIIRGNQVLYSQNIEFNKKFSLSAINTMGNTIYQTIKNKNGIYTSRIAYITRGYDNKYRVIVTAFDGTNSKVIVVSDNPISSLSWNRQSDSIAYVSYEVGKPVVVVQNIYNNNRKIISNFDGSNSSPAFDYEGSNLFVTLTKDYGSHIYEINQDEYHPGKAANLKVSYGSIDTEFDSKNGVMAFTSNKTGYPEIFISGRGRQNPVQISSGKYNTTPRISNDGKMVAYVHKEHYNYEIYLYDIVQKKTTKLTNGKYCLSPSFSPDDSLVLYISKNKLAVKNVVNSNLYMIGTPSNYKEIVDAKWSNV